MIYPTSTDYSLLYDLVQQGNEVLTKVTFPTNKVVEYIPCYFKKEWNGVKLLSTCTDNKEDFVTDIKKSLLEGLKLEIEWIVPTTAYIGEKYTIQIVPRFTKRDYQWVAVVSWKEEVLYYAMFQFDKIETYAYTKPLCDLLINHIDYCNTIESALKQGLEIVKQLQDHDGNRDN